MKTRKTMVWILTVALALAWAGCRKKAPENLMEEALIAYKNGDFMGATVKCRKIVEQAPDGAVSNRARWILSDILSKNQDTQGAYDMMREIYPRAGLTSQLGQDAFMQSIEILATAARFDEAISQILSTSSTLVVAKSPEEAKTLAAGKPGAMVATPEFATRLALLLGHMYRVSGDETKAKAQFESLKETCPDDFYAVQAMERLIEKLSQDGKIQEAIDLYRDYLAKRPDSEMKATILFGIGFFHNRLPHDENDAAGKEADSKAAQEALGESVRLYEEKIAATADEEKRVDLLMQLTKVFDEMGKRDEAKKMLEEQVASLSNPRARSTLMLFVALDVYFETGQYDKARELCAQVASEYPDTQAALRAHKAIAIVNRAMAIDAESKAADKATSEALKAAEAAATGTVPVGESVVPTAAAPTTESLSPAAEAPAEK